MKANNPQLEGEKESGVSGLLLLNKKPGLTSFETLGPLKRIFSTKKVGHTGTLDKFAEGLLLVLVGRAVKLCPWFLSRGKCYEGTIRLGVETDTLDPEGSVVAEAPPPSREALEAALPGFRGDILQAPPVYSAIHVNGQRVHRLARSGIVPEMEKRPVSIYQLELTSYDPPCASIRVNCSSGTYIRSLARDIALAAGSRGHLIGLTRTSIAGFPLYDAVGSGEGEDVLHRSLRPIDVSCFIALGLPFVLVNGESVKKIIHGKNLDQIIDEGAIQYPALPADGVGKTDRGNFSLGVFEDKNNHTDCGAKDYSNTSFAGIVEKNNGRWRYGYVYAASGKEPV
jgi:tRNA pseudouridine55 synthase